MKNFNEYIKMGVIKRISPNLSIARDILEESERKHKSLNEILTKIELSDDNSNDIIEYCYDILIGLIRSMLFIEGYKSTGEGSHEAEVSYFLILGFSETDARFVDELRYFRNKIKYYGKKLNKEYANKVILFLNKNYQKLLNKNKVRH